MKGKLKPCPVCGTNPIEHDNHPLENEDYWIECVECALEFSGGKNKEALIMMWNARPQWKESQ